MCPERRHGDLQRSRRKLSTAVEGLKTRLAGGNWLWLSGGKRSLMLRRQSVIPVLGLALRRDPLSHPDKSSGAKMIRHCSRSIYSENISPLILCLGSRRMNQLFSADGASCDSKKTHNAPIRKTNNWSRQWFIEFKCNGKASHYSLCRLHLGMFTIQTPRGGITPSVYLNCRIQPEKRWQSNC